MTQKNGRSLATVSHEGAALTVKFRNELKLHHNSNFKIKYFLKGGLKPWFSCSTKMRIDNDVKNFMIQVAVIVGRSSKNYPVSLSAKGLYASIGEDRNSPQIQDIVLGLTNSFLASKSVESRGY